MARVYVIAEAGVNHNGSLDMAKRLVDVAAGAGADAVKFQTFRATNLASSSAPKAAYQKENTDRTESQLDMLKKLELGEDAHHTLIKHCGERGIQFLSTPFDLASADLLLDVLKLARVKISSGEITNGPLLLHVASKGSPVILSTGMSTLGEVEEALGALAFGYMGAKDSPCRDAFKRAFASGKGQAVLRKKVILLHCTTQYPAPFEDVNLRSMDTLRNAFGLPVGYSDHTAGISIPIAAVARGAVVVEKHFTLDRNLPGPDHKASLEPDELIEMICSIRQVECALGTGVKAPASSEVDNIDIVRKALVAAEDVRQGEKFSVKNLTVKRSGGGISPMKYWDYIGMPAIKNYAEGEKIK